MTTVVAGAASAETVHQWFLLLQRYATVVLRLLALGLACQIVGLGDIIAGRRFDLAAPFQHIQQLEALVGMRRAMPFRLAD